MKPASFAAAEHSETRSAGVAPASTERADEALSRRGVWIAAMIWVAGATALQLFRQPGEPSWSSVWQEDGGVFLTDALQDPVASIADPYNAYLHVVPRLVSAGIAPLPLDWAPLLLSASAALIVALVSLYVYFASAAVIASQWVRVLLAALVVLIPAAGYETNANIANIHWYLIFAAFWVFITAPETRGGVVLGGIIVAASVLSDPLTGLLLPLALWRAITARTALQRAIPLIFCVALALQGVLGVVEDPVAPYAPSHIADLPGIYALRVAGSVLVGDQFLDNLWRSHGYGFALPALALVAAACAYGLRALRGQSRWFIALALALSVLYLAVPLMLRGTENFLDRGDFTLNGSRYTLLPVLFLLTALLVIADRAQERMARAGRLNLQLGVTVFVGFLVLTNYSIFSVRTDGPNWDRTVATARKLCLSRDGVGPGERTPLAGSIPSRTREVGEARIPVAPNIAERPFAVVVECDRLR